MFVLLCLVSPRALRGDCNNTRPVLGQAGPTTRPVLGRPTGWQSTTVNDLNLKSAVLRPSQRASKRGGGSEVRKPRTHDAEIEDRITAIYLKWLARDSYWWRNHVRTPSQTAASQKYLGTLIASALPRKLMHSPT